MGKFKKGDIVKCIDTRGITLLNLNAEYKVIEYRVNKFPTVLLEGVRNQNIGFSADRFDLVKSVDDLVRSVDDVVEEEYDYINPKHYQLAGMETFDAIVQIWGLEKAIAHCEMCAFKYQMRLGKKPDQPVERDQAKIKWYEDKAEELRKDTETQLLQALNIDFDFLKNK